MKRPTSGFSTCRPCSRHEAYRAEITYGTNNEYGFDYLRDNLIVSDLSQCVQRPLHFAIVDEVDSILIDEARTPLIISGPTDQTTDLYYRINRHHPAAQTGTGLHDRGKNQDRLAHGRGQRPRRKAAGRG